MPRPHFNKASMEKLAKKLGVMLENLPLETFIEGTKIEYDEHGPKTKSGWPVIKTVEEAAQIALSHLSESIYYYDELEKMEKKLKRKPKIKRNPQIFY
jgi:hypothetical protein